MSMEWFRYYNEAAKDDKIEMISRSIDWQYVKVLGCWSILECKANASPIRGSLYITQKIHFSDDNIAAILRISTGEWEALSYWLKELHMVDIDEQGGYHLTNWEKRQFESDSSTERVIRYRSNRQKNGLTKGTSYSTEDVCNRYSNTCVYCGSQENLCVDHMYPVSMGGTDDPLNLACSCKRCNSGKAGRTPELAGYKFQNKAAEANYRKYVTVTLSHQNQIQITDTDLKESVVESAKTEILADKKHPSFLPPNLHPSEEDTLFLQAVCITFDSKIANTGQGQTLLALKGRYGREKVLEALGHYANKGISLDEAVTRANGALPTWGQGKKVSFGPPIPTTTPAKAPVTALDRSLAAIEQFMQEQSQHEHTR